MVAGLGARFGNHTSYQSCDANSLFGTPRGGRRTEPMRVPSFAALRSPNRTTRTAIAFPVVGVTAVAPSLRREHHSLQRFAGLDERLQAAQHHRPAVAARSMHGAVHREM